VEKGGVAQVLRQGNAPPATYTVPTWVPNRRIWTHAAGSTSLTPFSTASTGLSSLVVDWARGAEDGAALEKASNQAANTRPSIHGDVVHSRPLPVNYGGSLGVTVFYGANDGMLRAVDAATGRERWALVAPEFYSKFQRLHSNSPTLKYPGVPVGTTPAPTAKDYFFDGSIGLFQSSDSSKVWIFPTMRRGGRMVYAVDVTSPELPIVKWRIGCPELETDNNCSGGFGSIGQTWSAPNVAFLKATRPTPRS
jgi:type IV pilus assembly protein PilY1